MHSMHDALIMYIWQPITIMRYIGLRDVAVLHTLCIATYINNQRTCSLCIASSKSAMLLLLHAILHRT